VWTATELVGRSAINLQRFMPGAPRAAPWVATPIYDGRVPNESEQERITQLLSPAEADEPVGEDLDDASLVRMITSQPDDQTVLSELIRRAVPASSE
jgi:hypothetical protein